MGLTQPPSVAPLSSPGSPQRWEIYQARRITEGAASALEGPAVAIGAPFLPIPTNARGPTAGTIDAPLDLAALVTAPQSDEQLVAGMEAALLESPAADVELDKIMEEIPVSDLWDLCPNESGPLQP